MTPIVVALIVESIVVVLFWYSAMRSSIRSNDLVGRLDVIDARIERMDPAARLWIRQHLPEELTRT